ncbi:uncharacterized protein Eint_031410 [Encephalitozoon intestinalis ATCC 50506]|uniref:J domain-containing protein n=1 Tax=Encephalitozoon intestinalis (strain ATCC 50506) TaxID=876142 RepID=E0S6E8_ENCIT|nr:uncharacterized protein Eint_031410 [Encephalitozoon intestinalis ATCC 50506]ADM11283.1 hypothetical protein Eint_031410 [Encephalitozoon intestinalis ATCC 50506]UTX44951.1 DnaJ domain-containing protein [Encephalitozoon intestinalis]
MSIFSLLGVKKGASKEEVRMKYLKRLLLIHPDRSKGDINEYIKLRESYEKYERGEEYEEVPYFVCNRDDIGSIVCRCGGKYKVLNEENSRVECEFCSCFIEIEDFLRLPAPDK